MKVENSIAFNTAPADDLNQLAQTLDKRLYLFAYYSPKPLLVNESYMLQFFTAVINLYGLFNDCGSFVLRTLFDSRNVNSLFEKDNQGKLSRNSLQINRRLSFLSNVLTGLRNSACHNNALEFPNNQKNIEKADKLFMELGLSRNAMTDRDWELCLHDICRRSDEIINDIRDCLNGIKHLPEDYKYEVINYWINDGLCRWYLLVDRKHEMLSYLTSLRNMCRDYQVGPLSVWLYNNFGANDYTYWLNNQNVSNLLNDVTHCPQPALPIDIYKALTMDVRKIVSNSH